VSDLERWIGSFFCASGSMLGASLFFGVTGVEPTVPWFLGIAAVNLVIGLALACIVETAT
jgi:hypothetical protein